METRELRYFVAVAEELHFARAAARVGIEQSPLSKAISELERRVGVQLFVRTSRSTTLTRAGEILLQDARCILAGVDRALQNIAVAASGRSGPLRIGVGDGLAQPRIARLLAESRRTIPNVDIQVTHGPLEDQLRGLRTGLLDVGFALSSSGDQEVRCLPLWKDDLVVVTRQDRQPLGQQGIQKIEPDSRALIVLGERSRSGCEAMDTWLLSSMRGCGRIDYVASPELLLTLVAAGYGTGITSAAHAETVRRPDLVARPLHTQGAQITTFMIQRSQGASNLVARFTQLTQKLL